MFIPKKTFTSDLARALRKTRIKPRKLVADTAPGLLRGQLEEANKAQEKVGRWTKNLPPGLRERAEILTALRGYEKLRNEIPSEYFHATPGDPRVSHIEQRLQRLTEKANLGTEGVPRAIGGTKVNPRTGLSKLEEMLGMNSPEMREFRPPKRRPPSFEGKIPGPPPGAPAAESRGWEGFSKAWKERAKTKGAFLDELLARMKGLREFAAKNKKPLLYTGAGASALGLGLLGLHAATKKRHQELHGKTVDNQ